MCSILDTILIWMTVILVFRFDLPLCHHWCESFDVWFGFLILTKSLNFIFKHQLRRSWGVSRDERTKPTSYYVSFLLCLAQTRLKWAQSHSTKSLHFRAQIFNPFSLSRKVNRPYQRLLNLSSVPSSTFSDWEAGRKGVLVSHGLGMWTKNGPGWTFSLSRLHSSLISK